MHNKVKHSLNMALIQTNCYLFLFLSYRFVLQNAVIFPYKFSLMSWQHNSESGYTKKSDKGETARKNTLEDNYLKNFGVLE